MKKYKVSKKELILDSFSQTVTRINAIIDLLKGPGTKEKTKDMIKLYEFRLEISFEKLRTLGKMGGIKSEKVEEIIKQWQMIRESKSYEVDELFKRG